MSIFSIFLSLNDEPLPPAAYSNFTLNTMLADRIVCQHGGLEFNNYMVAGYFPKSVELGSRLEAWVEDEIDEWIADKISKRDASSTQLIKPA